MNIQIRIQTQHTKQKLHALQCKDNDEHPLIYFYIYKHIYNYKKCINNTYTEPDIHTREQKTQKH